MPAVLENMKCAECGQSHTLCLLDGDLIKDGRTYQYTCPIAKKRARFMTDRWARVDLVCPAGAVPIYPVG